MGCHFFLQCMKVKSESEVTQLCPTLSNPMDCSLPGSHHSSLAEASELNRRAAAPRCDREQHVGEKTEWQTTQNQTVQVPRGRCQRDWTRCGQGEKVKVPQSCPALCDPTDYTVHGILQARILKWVTFPFSRGPSQPRDQTQVSCIAGGSFTS